MLIDVVLVGGMGGWGAGSNRDLFYRKYTPCLHIQCVFLIFFKLCTLFQKLVQIVVKKNLKYESILYNSTKLSVDLTSTEFQIPIIFFSRNIKSLI